MSTVELLAKRGVFPPSHNQWDRLYRYYNYLYLPTKEGKDRVEEWLQNHTADYYQHPSEFHATFELQPLTKIIPGPNISDSIGPKMIYLPIIVLSVIAGAILLSAIFNYTNLSMARAMRRAREVGVRKLNGASRTAVFLQFTIEAIIISLFSLGLGVALFVLLKDEFIRVLPRAEAMLELQLSTELLLWFVGFAILTGLIAGVAPSTYFARLSSFKALRSGRTVKTLSGISFRKALIIAQFALSIIFILAVSITYKQYDYSVHHDLGFDRENILNVSLKGIDAKLLGSELSKLSDVQNISFSSFIPGVGTWESIKLVDARSEDSVWAHQMHADPAYFENLSIPLVAGRQLREGENDAVERSMLVNATFVKKFGLGTPHEALGTLYMIEGGTVEIVGVVKDFIYSNLEEPVGSFVIRMQKDRYRFANVKIASTDLPSTLQRIEQVWDTIESDQRMEARFFDDQIEGYYQFFVDIMKVFAFIGFLAVSISCLGLFGMTIYAMETRRKEIGIRKTFGASERTLILLLSRDFLKMLGWAIIIGTPISYFLFDRVVLAQSFYRTDITFVEVGGSIFLLVGLCFLTVFTQTLSASRTNPASVLREE